MKRLLYIFSFFLFFAASYGRAQTAGQAELLAQRENIAPGQEFYLALELTLPRGGHVYWKNPGDAGEAVDLKLNLPPGFREKGRYWPAPEKFTVGPFTEYGYRSRAYLLVKIQAPENLRTGEIFEISGRAVWLACFNECIPMAQDVAVLIAAGQEAGGEENEEVLHMISELPDKEEEAVFFETPDSLILSVPAEKQARSAYFFPADQKVLAYSAPQNIKTADGKMYLFMKKAPAEVFMPADILNGTVVFYNVQGERIRAADVLAVKTEENLPVFSEPFVLFDFMTALLFAFLGGVLLNLMPCVFPVLSLKAFRLLNAGRDIPPAERRRAGISYAAGVLVSFMAVGLVLIALRAAGSEMGWGFQLQYPPFVLGLCLFLFFLGLVFSDIVSIGEKLSAFSLNVGRNWGDFGTGILAVVVATPCAAPFMGTALGYGLMNPAAVTICIFLAMGLGLAFPFLLLDFYPALGRFLPKAGAWTALFRQFLAFPLYAAAAWLLWVLAAQEGSSALAVGLGCLIAVAFASWLAETAVHKEKLRKFSFAVTGATLILIVCCLYSLSPARLHEKERMEIEWLPYNTESIQEYRRAGVPVFIKFSAKWCLTCLVNEKTAFSSPRLGQAFRQKGVVAFSADWTSRSDEITAALESFSRGGIPLYVYYAPHAREAVVLPQLITEKTVLSLLDGL